MSLTPEPRIGDSERDEAIAVLGEHYAAGRITKEEYDERSGFALRARTAADLRPLFVDLPPSVGRNGFGARGGTASRSGRTWDPRTGWSRPWPAGPLLPILMLLAVVLVVTTDAWWLLFIFGWFFFCAPWRYRRRR
jgi:Domain of unknown function (DUF1707)